MGHFPWQTVSHNQRLAAKHEGHINKWVNFANQKWDAIFLTAKGLVMLLKMAIYSEFSHEKW